MSTAKTKTINRPLMTEEEKKAVGRLAGDSARKVITDACAKVGLTVEKVAKTVLGAMDANVTRAALTMEGEFVYSKPLVDHVTRLKAVERAEILLDLRPVDKKQIDLVSQLSDEEIDKQLNLILGQSNGDK